MKLIISFKDKHEEFAHGVEFGRIMEKIESGQCVIHNNHFPVRLSNKELISKLCQYHNVTPVFGEESFGEWVDFIGINRKGNLN